MTFSDLSSYPTWDETNGWRQGSVLKEEDAISLGVLVVTENTQFAMVISHDCDCVADLKREPDVEIVIGSFVKKADGHLTFAKSTRRLHLEVSGCGKRIELPISKRVRVEKRLLAALRPDEAWSLTAAEKTILGRWLAARYNRASFPTKLVDRLRPIEKAFKEIIQRLGGAVVGVFVSFDPDDEAHVSDAEPYTLDIAVVYDDRESGAADSCHRLCNELLATFREAYRRDPDGAWSSIELSSCEAIPDTQFTYRDSLTMRLYRFDDLSLGSDPQGTLPS